MVFDGLNVQFEISSSRKQGNVKVVAEGSVVYDVLTIKEQVNYGESYCLSIGKVDGPEAAFVKLRTHYYRKVSYYSIVLWFCFYASLLRVFTGSLLFPGSLVTWLYGSLFLFPDSMVSTSFRIHNNSKVGRNL